MDDETLLEGAPRWSDDQRAEFSLGTLVCVVVGLLLAMLVFVFREAWPSFSHNGLSWFGSGGGLVDNQITRIFQSGDYHGAGGYVYTFHAWPLIWSTILITTGAVVIAFVCSLFIAVFIVEFAPLPMQRVLQPVIRLLASVPSVIYGLLGVLVVVPFLNNHVITNSEKASVSPTISLSGYGLITAILILTVMISPVMVAVFADGLRAVPRNWIEGSWALGVNRWRSFWKVAVKTARPALVAGAVLATARGLGESVMLSMVSGGIGFAPKPWDGLIFLFEPSEPLASSILQYQDQRTSPPMESTLFAIGAVLLFSAVLLSLAGWAAKQPMKRYGVVA
jgi:phosphate transport system permease protein